MDRTQRVIDFAAKHYQKLGPVFLQDVYESAKVIDVRIENELPVVRFAVHTHPHLANNMEMVHGGASSSLLVIFTALSLAADDKYFQSEALTEEELNLFVQSTPSTRSVDVQIIQAVPLNADIEIECKVMSNTKSNAFVVGTIFSPTGKVLVTAVHDMMRGVNTAEATSLQSRFPNKL